MNLTEIHFDALREIANIGCGNAATALSQMLGGRRIEIDVPTAEIAHMDRVTERLGGPNAQVVAVSFDMLGGAKGKLQLALPPDSAEALVAILLGPSHGQGDHTAAGRSAISEVGNILASAYLNAIGRAVGMTLLPSIPHFGADIAKNILTQTIDGLGSDSERTLLMQTRFTERAIRGDEHPTSFRFFFGHFLVFPDADSLPKLLSALGLS